MDEEQRARLWEYRLHEDGLFSERQNFFLVAESMLAVAYTTALTATEPKIGVARIISGIALVLTLTWLWVNKRQYDLVRHVHHIALAELPEFAEVHRTRPTTRISSTKVLAFVVAPLIATMWVILLVWA